MAAEEPRLRGDEPLDRLVKSLTREQLVEVVVDAADWHDDVARAIRLAAARNDFGLAVLRREIDRALRTRRFLDYRASMEWAQA
jgi:hypothetical protein